MVSLVIISYGFLNFPIFVKTGTLPYIALWWGTSKPSGNVSMWHSIKSICVRRPGWDPIRLRQESQSAVEIYPFDKNLLCARF